MLARSVARSPQALPRAAAALLRPRQLAGAAKVHVCDQEDLIGASAVARDAAVIEMGVRYEPGVPSPMEGTFSIEPIVVDGLVAKTGGGSIGSPLQMIKLCQFDPTPVACKYTGLRCAAHAGTCDRPRRTIADHA
jgi:NADH dehydrogenase (ubiquinone) Fe-S protein 6